MQQVPGISLMDDGWSDRPAVQFSQVGRHAFDGAQPRADHRRVRLRRANANFRTKIQIANLIHQTPGQSQSLVGREAWIVVFVQGLQQEQCLVEWQRADGIGQEQLEFFRRERFERRKNFLPRFKKRHVALVLNSFARKLLPDYFRKVCGMGGKGFGISIPRDLGSAGEGGHRIRFDAAAWDSKFFALHQRRAGATKRIQNGVPGI